ncbi:MAG TPA: hypothetical protein V6D05_17045, partial [Stenomitos sp.]
RYSGFPQSNMVVRGVFDVSPEAIGRTIGDVTVSALDELPAMAARDPIDIAILTVPASQAQEALDFLVSVGVRAVLNFSPVALVAPASVIVRNVDITSELQQITYMLTHREDEDAL